MVLFHQISVVGSLVVAVAAQTSITLNPATKYQIIDGFGISQAFGRANELKNAKTSTQKAALDLLFSTETGAGFAIIRNRIGSGGSGDSILPTSPGSPSGTPKYTWNGDDAGQVFFSKAAMSYGVKTIYADAWSAPGFMKTSGAENKAGYLCGSTGHTCSSGDWRQAYANFLVQYIKYYAQEGIPITHVGFLNEPDYVVDYSNMQISLNAQEATSFIPTLYNTLKSNGINSVKIACCDAVGWGSQQTYTTNLVNAGMTQYLGVITSHSYSKDPVYLGQTSLPKWNTEAGTGGSYRLVTTWYSNGALNEGFTWAQKLADAMVNAQLSAYLYWEGYETNQQQSGSHLIDSADGNTITISGIFWAFAMWSRHIRPGATRIQVSGTIASVIIGAFQNTDGSIVAVLTNSGSSEQSSKININGFTAGSAAAWVTANGKNFASTSAAISGGAVTVSVPAKGVVTVKITKGSGSTTSAIITTSTRLGTSTTRAATTTARTSTASGSGGTCAALYGQCGGNGYTGPTCCASGSSCKFSNDYYSQCL